MLHPHLCVLNVILRRVEQSSLLPKYLKWQIKKGQTYFICTDLSAWVCLCLCEWTEMCQSLCTVWLSDVHGLCSSGTLLEAAVSIVLEWGVSTYYTSQMVQRKYERGRERQREMELHFLCETTNYQHSSAGVNIYLILNMFSFMKHYTTLD